MISELLTVTDAAYGGSLPVTTRHLFAQIVNGVPAVHNGGGQFTPVANDLNGSWSYQRFRGPIEATPSQLVGDPCTGVRVSVPLRIVALLPRDVCMEVAQAAVASLRGAQRAAKIAIGASSVGIDRVTWSIAETASGEFNPAPQIPTSKALLIIDLTVTVEASQACVSACDATDVTCALIEAASLDKIRECLGDRLAELCDIPPEPCAPTTVNGTTSDTPTITVLQGGNEVGTLDPDTGVHTVPECEPCDPELELRLNGGGVYKTLQLECGSQEFDNIVTYPDGTPVGDWNAIEDRIEVPAPIPCDPCPLGYTLQDTAENVILAGVINDPCEEPTLLLTAPDGSVQLQDSAANPIGSPVAVRSNQTGVAVTAPDAKVMTTDGLTVVQDIRSNAPGNLPQSVIKFKDAANADQVTAASNTEFAGGTLRPATQLPRVTIYESDGVTVQGFADVGNPFYTVDACPTPPTLCDLLGDVLPANAQTQILDCVTAETGDALAAILCTPPTHNIVQFTASGTYTKPAGLKELVVFAMGPGGGGGAGRSVSTSLSATGGGYGGSGAFVIRRLDASVIGATETVTIGAPGSGGSGVINNAGGNGTNGGDAQFGLHVLAKGGGLGRGGNSATPAGNQARGTDCTPIGWPWAISGYAPVAGGLSSGVQAGAGGSTGVSVSARAGGGGNRTGAGTPNFGGNGGGNYQGQVLVPGGAGGTANGQNGANGANNVKLDYMANYTDLIPTIGPGTAGGGGAYSSSGPAGNGGSGGYGAGGSGGGGAIQTIAGGSGGAGGAAFVVILEIIE